MTDKDMALCVDRALCTAAWEGDTETVRALLDAGADVHAWTDAPLWWAAMKSHAYTMRALLEAGADQDIALVVAAENGLIELVRDLLAAGANIHAYHGLALNMAAHNGHTKTMNELIAAKEATSRRSRRRRRRSARESVREARQGRPRA